MSPLITIHNQSTKRFYQSGGDDVVADIDSNFAALFNAIAEKTEIRVGLSVGADYQVGSSDAGAKINSAISDVGAGIVSIGAGSFNLDEPIAPSSYIWIKGSGMDITKIYPDPSATGANGDAIRLVKPTSGSYAQAIRISDLTIDCSNQYSGSPLVPCKVSL
jgi:hypothetical protein